MAGRWGGNGWWFRERQALGGGEAAHLEHVVGGLVTVTILQFRPHFKLADAAEVGTVEHHQWPPSVHAQVVALPFYDATGARQKEARA